MHFKCEPAYGWIFRGKNEQKQIVRNKNEITEDQIKLISVSQNKLTSIFCDVD